MNEYKSKDETDPTVCKDGVIVTADRYSKFTQFSVFSLLISRKDI